MKLNRLHKQSGATLMEVLVAMSISLVVTAAMIAMMSNTLGTTSRIIQMTKLQDDLRVAMQMMTRDLRRSNYNADSLLCFANEDCGGDGTLATSLEVYVDVSGECFAFVTDRNSDNYASNIVEAGAFRRIPPDVDDPDSFGFLEMYTGSDNADAFLPDSVCDLSPQTGGWVQITDPETIDISGFTVVDDEDGLSYEQLIRDDNENPKVYQRVRKVRMSIDANLVLDSSISRTLEDIITVRNDLLTVDPS